jgi:hypothetical protein
MANALSRVRTRTKLAAGIPLATLALFYMWAASVRVFMGGFPEPSTWPSHHRRHRQLPAQHVGHDAKLRQL